MPYEFGIIESRYSKSTRKMLYWVSIIVILMLSGFGTYLILNIFSLPKKEINIPLLMLFYGIISCMPFLLVNFVIDRFTVIGNLIFDDEQLKIRSSTDIIIAYKELKYIRIQPELSGAMYTEFQKSYKLYLSTVYGYNEIHILRKQYKKNKVIESLFPKYEKDIFYILKEKRIKHGLTKCKRF